MLRLRVEASLPWMDRKGRMRSLEAFTLLSREAREVLQSQEASGFTAWELGVLSDVAYDPEAVKPQLIDVGQEAPIAGFAVGYEDAQLVGRRLAPLWSQFLSWFAEGAPMRAMFSDRFWHPLAGSWVGLPRAIADDLVQGFDFTLEPVASSPLYTARLSPAHLSTLPTHWWPSGLGTFIGLRMNDLAAEMRVAATGVIELADLPFVQGLFQTSRSYDNVGVEVLTCHNPWPKLRSELLELGWYTGAVIQR